MYQQGQEIERSSIQVSNKNSIINTVKWFLVGAVSFGVLSLFSKNSKETVSETVSLKRGDKIIDPETGEQLQVRGVGGRPKKKVQDKVQK